ncbi:MAG: ATP-dependent Clp protease adaptor ClpS [Armatimonadota bacterium]
MATQTLPELDHSPSEGILEEWQVIVFNNEVNTYEEVMTVLMLSTGCDAEEAYIETWEVDHDGQCCVHRSSEEECNRVAEVIRAIGIVVETKPGA